MNNAHTQKPFKPESIEALRARFPAALEDLMEDPTDPRILEDKHFFDFEDGTRLHISRDFAAVDNIAKLIGDKAQIVSCIGGIASPNATCSGVITLLAARIAINFVTIAGDEFGDPFDTQILGRNAVLMVWKYEQESRD